MASIPITKTKIIVPQRREDILTRKRLLDMMNELLDVKLAILAAPAGYGKTSLLIDFAAQTPWPICWYAIDSLDSDLLRFLAYFINSIKFHFPKFGMISLGSINNLGNETLDISRIVSTIVNDIYENINEEFVLILDDFHLVEDNPEVIQFINLFIQDVGENAHIIISSRKLLSLPDLPLLVARNQVGGLSYDELAFLPEEVQSLLLRNFQMNISDEVAQNIIQQTEGWITGLLLSTHLIGDAISERLRLAKNSGVGLYDYLAQQILNVQSPEMRDFLLRTSLLEEFDAKICEKVIGKTLGVSANWWKLMQDALQLNLFVLPIGEGHTLWLRYHHLFRDFLQTQIKRERPDETRTIIINLANDLSDRHDWLRAYSLYRQLDDSVAIVRLIEKGSSAMIAEGKLQPLHQWLDDLPPTMLNTNPTLLSLQSALFTMRGNLQESLRRSQQVLRMLGDSSDIRTHALTLVREATTYRLLGNYNQALENAQNALTLVANHPELELIRAEALRTVGITYFSQGELEKALDYLTQSLTAFYNANGQPYIPKLLCEIGLTHKVQGEHAQAEQDYTQALVFWQAEGNLTWQANILNNLGVLQHLRGDFESAAQSLEKSIICARTGTDRRLEVYGLASLGDLYRDLEAYREAQDVYKLAHGFARQMNERFLIFYLDLAEGKLFRIQENYARAENLIDAALMTAQSGGSAYDINLGNLERSVLLLKTGKAQKARGLLTFSYDYFHTHGHSNETNQALLLLAIADLSLGVKEDALESFKKVHNIITTTDSGLPLILICKEFEAFLRSIRGSVGKQAKDFLVHVENFKDSLPQLRRTIRQQADIVPFAPPKMTIQSFGKTRVRINNHYISSKDWQTHTARDLFFLFLAHPEGLTKEQVGLFFWPDSPPDEMKLRFKNSLYRARHAFGRESIILNDEFYTFNRSLDYEYDVEVFKTSYALASRSTDPEEKIKHYLTAVQNYNGTYLPDIDETWIVAERERYHQMNLDALLRLTNLYVEKRAYKTALRYCYQALGEDPCLEEAHRMAMRIHAAMGNRAAIVRQYDRCKEALVEEIGAPPSEQTTDLYNSLSV